MEKYPANDMHPRTPRQKEEKKVEKKVESVVTKAAVKRKKSPMRRIKEAVTGDDTRGVLDYVVFDVVIPRGKDLIFDVITEGAEKRMFGEVRHRSRRGGSWGTAQVQHTRYSTPSGMRQREERPTLSRRARATHDLDEIILATRPEAEMVLSKMDELIDQFECASLRDLYDLVDIPANFTDEKFGWTDLRTASVSRGGGGYLLNMPRPEPID